MLAVLRLAVIVASLSDPGGAPLAGVEVQLTGIDVDANYTARTDAKGRIEFPKVAAGTYRVEVRQPTVVATPDLIRVTAGESLNTEIRTALRAQIGMTLSAASAQVLRRWASGGPPPAAAMEWECTVNGQRCTAPARELDAMVLPSLIPQPLGEVMVNALMAVDGKGTVEMTGTIGADGFLSGLSVSAATSPELAAAVLLEVGRLRWEPARLRGVAVSTSATIDVRF
jgi:hypothetical protein